MLLVGLKAALRVARDFVRTIASDNLPGHFWSFGEMSFHQLLQPSRPVVDVIIGRADKGLGKSVERRDDFFVGSYIVGCADLQPG